MIDFDAVRLRHPLAEFCKSRGIQLRRDGTSGRFVCQCAFHQERTPSFTIYPENLAHCYGCGWHGDVIDLCAALDGLQAAEAARKLSRGSLPDLAPLTRPLGCQATVPKVDQYQLSEHDMTRMAAAAHRLAQSDQLIERLVAERPEWVPETIRGAALDGDLGVEDNMLLFGYTHGIKARKLNEKIIWWLFGGADGQCWRQSLLLRLPCHQLIRLTEGETDALTLLSMGKEEPGKSLVLGLAGASIIPNPEPFDGREIVIIPDPDEAGAKAERQLRKRMEPVASLVATISLQEVLRGSQRSI